MCFKNASELQAQLLLGFPFSRLFSCGYLDRIYNHHFDDANRSKSGQVRKGNHWEASLFRRLDRQGVVVDLHCSTVHPVLELGVGGCLGCSWHTHVVLHSWPYTPNPSIQHTEFR